jgi:hypothetical protein
VRGRGVENEKIKSGKNKNYAFMNAFVTCGKVIGMIFLDFLNVFLS